MLNFRIIVVFLVLAGCGQLDFLSPVGKGAASGPDQTRPQARPGTLQPPPETARTVEEFDTTTQDQRAAAAQPAEGAARLLGTTIASLGDPASPGFWLETPLVDAPTPGRVTYAPTGKSARVELRPLPAAASGGSRVSLAAMRLLGAPLTGLPELGVYSEE